MLGFGETKITKGNFYTAKKRVKIWDVNVRIWDDNIVLSKLIKTKTNSKYLIGYSWLLQKSTMCDKVIDDYRYALEFVPECYKTQKTYDKAVDTYPSTIEYVSDRFKTQEMCHKAVDKCTFVINSFSDQYKTQEMCDKIVFADFFS